jgi:nucleotide-binding universal stress UspA family protein
MSENRSNPDEEAGAMKIVVGYDGSETAKRGLAKAAELAQGGGSVTVVSVVSVHPGAVHGAAPIDSDEVAERNAELSEAHALLTANAIDATLVEGRGDPADAIIEAATNAGADLVVVGTRGHGGLQRALLGSVSTKVVHDSPCDVLVVR